MVCPKCGAEFPEGKAFCPGCGQPLISVEPPEAEPEPATGDIVRPAAVRVRYAGFWLRFLAYIFDWAALSLVMGPLSARLFPNLELPSPPPFSTKDPAAMEAALREFWNLFFQRLPTIIVAELIVFSIMGVYFSLMESSAWQATLGKRLLGLQVTDLQGRRLSFARATARYFAKLLSSFSFCIGYAMAGITKRKQALHDILAECLVIRKMPPS